MAQSKNSPQKVAAAMKRADALRMRAAGLTYEEIGEKLGCSEAMARKHVTNGMEAIREDMAASKAVFKQRIEDMIKAHWQAAVSGKDTDSAALVLRLLDRQARLEGLDAPAKSESSVTMSTLTDGELAEEARRLGINIDEPAAPSEAEVEKSSH